MNHQQIYGAGRHDGYKEGVRDGIERMQGEGWRRLEPDECPPRGSRVKLLTPTCFGWIGYGIIMHVSANGVACIRADDCETSNPAPGDSGTVDCMVHELAILESHP